MIKLITFYLIISLGFYGCGSKKKVVEREKTSVSTVEEKSVKEELKTDVKTDSISISTTKNITITDDQEIEVTAKNDSVIIEEIKTLKGRKFIVTGADRIVIRDTKKLEKAQENSSVRLKKQENTKKVTKTDEKIKVDEKKSKRNTDTVIKRNSLWIIGIVLVLFLVFKRVRKFIGIPF